MLFLALLFSLAVANPICPAIEQDANFDDIPGSPLVGNTPPPQGYRGLYFQGFTVTTQDAVALGVLAHSPPNLGTITAMTQTLQGTSMLTVNYPGTNTTSFSLESFYFGNVISAGNSAAAEPAPVNLQVTGYQGNDNQVTNAKQICSKQFQYNPSTNAGVQQMAFTGQISGCTDLQFLIITFSPQGGQSSFSEDDHLLLDDIRFSSKKC